MKFSHFLHPRLSFAAPVSGGNVNGAAIDTLGFEQVQPVVGVDQLPLDGVIDWKVQQVDDLAGTNPVDITGAAGSTITVTDDTVVAVTNLLADAEYTVVAPTVPARLRVQIIDTVATITTGTIRITGVAVNQRRQATTRTQLTSEDLDISAGAGVYTTATVWQSVSKIESIAVATLGGGGDETIEVGIDNSGLHVGRLDGVQLPRYIRLVTANVAGASGNMVGFFNLYSEKRQPTGGEFGAAEFGFQV